jgi:hypothetical protein
MVEEDMTVKYALKIHFDGAHALTYNKARPSRFGYPDEEPEWWTHRLMLLEKYVFPSIERQTFKDFDVIGLFSQRTRDKSGAVAKAFRDRGHTVVFNSAGSIINAYNGACDFLVLMHLDSDDIYDPNALGMIAEVEPMPGMAVFFQNGYLYGIEGGDGRLVEYNADACGPGPYFAKVYTRRALKSFESWENYNKRHRLGGVHHTLRKCRQPVALKGRHFCGLVHASNVTRGWHNRNMNKRVGKEILGSAKEEILRRFEIDV